VTDVLDLLASGLSAEQALEERLDLEIEDIFACLRFASLRIDHSIVPAWRSGSTISSPPGARGLDADHAIR
jgi:hypothetical protein